MEDIDTVINLICVGFQGKIVKPWIFYEHLIGTIMSFDPLGKIIASNDQINIIHRNNVYFDKGRQALFL